MNTIDRYSGIFNQPIELPTSEQIVFFEVDDASDPVSFRLDLLYPKRQVSKCVYVFKIVWGEVPDGWTFLQRVNAGSYAGAFIFYTREEVRECANCGCAQ